MIVSNVVVKINSPEEICSYCRFVGTNEDGRITGCKKGRKNSGNNNRIPCVGCRKFVKIPGVEMPYALKKEAQKH